PGSTSRLAAWLAALVLAGAGLPNESATQSRPGARRQGTPAPRSGPDLSVTGAAIAGTAREDGWIRSLDVEAELVNVGHVPWGRDGSVQFTISRGTPEQGLDPIVEKCGADCTRQVERTASAPEGLPAGVRGTVRVRLVRRNPDRSLAVRPLPLGVQSGEWYTVEIALRSRADVNDTNDRLRLVFMLDEQGHVVENRAVRSVLQPSQQAR
ncbi:MAG: hypothetical protein ACREON_05530, partial [Gemmatimonadaceae bacterium]